MQNQSQAPDIDRSDSLNEYAGDLRTRIFKSQVEAARHFGVHRATISRYEHHHYENDNLNVTLPIEYLAELMRLFVEQYGETDADKAQLQAYFLQQMRRLLEKYAASYEYRRGFRDWGELCTVAADFIEERRGKTRDTTASQVMAQGTHGGQTAPSDAIAKPYLVPPLPPHGVVGRATLLDQIAVQLGLRQPGDRDLPPVALRGMGGIGKTTLAAAVGRSPEFVSAFPGGVLWVELGLRPVVRQLLNMWGDALGLDLLPERDDAACEAQLRSALYNRRALLILDDVWDAAAGTHFLLGGPYCRTLVTTREPGIAYALTTSDRTLRVDVLSLEHALEMLHRIAPAAVAADRGAAERLCGRLECLPLGIKLAGRLLATGSEVPSRMRRLVDELTEQREARLKLPQVEGRTSLEEASLRAILGMSVERLSEEDKSRFAMLGVFGGEPLTWEINAAASVWECSVEEAEDTTDRLIARALVEPRPGERYWMHALLADYAAEMLEEMGL